MQLHKVSEREQKLQFYIHIPVPEFEKHVDLRQNKERKIQLVPGKLEEKGYLQKGQIIHIRNKIPLAQ